MQDTMPLSDAGEECCLTAPAMAGHSSAIHPSPVGAKRKRYPAEGMVDSSTDAMPSGSVLTWLISAGKRSVERQRANWRRYREHLGYGKDHARWLLRAALGRGRRRGFFSGSWGDRLLYELVGALLWVLVVAIPVFYFLVVWYIVSTRLWYAFAVWAALWALWALWGSDQYEKRMKPLDAST